MSRKLEKELGTWSEKFNLFLVACQKRQNDEAHDLLQSIIDLTKGILGKVSGSTFNNSIVDVQVTIFIRLCLLYREVQLFHNWERELAELTTLIEEFYKNLSSSLPTRNLLFLFREIVSGEVEQIANLLKEGCTKDNLKIFHKESSNSALIDLLLTIPILMLSKTHREEFLNPEFGTSLATSISRLLSENKKEDYSRSVSIIAKDIFQLLTFALSKLQPMKSSTSHDFELLLSIVISSMTILSLNFTPFISSGPHYVAAILQKIALCLNQVDLKMLATSNQAELFFQTLNAFVVPLLDQCQSRSHSGLTEICDSFVSFSQLVISKYLLADTFELHCDKEEDYDPILSLLYANFQVLNHKNSCDSTYHSEHFSKTFNLLYIYFVHKKITNSSKEKSAFLQFLQSKVDFSQFLYQYIMEENYARLLNYWKSGKIKEFEAWKLFYEIITEAVLVEFHLPKDFMTEAKTILHEDYESYIAGVLSYYGESSTTDQNGMEEVKRLESQRNRFIKKYCNISSTTTLFRACYLRNIVRLTVRLHRQKLLLAPVAASNDLADVVREEYALENSNDDFSIKELKELLHLLKENIEMEENSCLWSLLAIDFCGSSDLLAISQLLQLSGRENLFQEIYSDLCTSKFYQRYGKTSLTLLNLLGVTHTAWNGMNTSFAQFDKASPCSVGNDLVDSLIHYVWTCNDHLSRPPCRSAQILDQDTAERVSLIAKCTSIVAEIRRGKSLTGESNTATVNHLLRHYLVIMAAPAWMYLFLARVLFFQYGDVVEALRYCRKGLASCSTSGSLSLHFYSIRFEISLLISEIYDFLGDPCRCLEFLCESLVFARSTSFLHQIFQLHAFRIFFRLKSDKAAKIFISLVSLPSTTSYTDILNAIMYFFPAIKVEMKSIFLQAKEQEDFSCLETLPGRQCLKYRHLYRLWGMYLCDLDHMSLQERRDQGDQISQYVITMAPPEYLQSVQRLLSLPSTDYSKADINILTDCLSDQISSKCCYQTVKQLRKLQSALLHSMKDQKRSNKSLTHTFLPLLSTLSSIRMSDELSEIRLNDLEASGDSSKWNDSILNDYGDMIHEAVHEGKSSAIESIVQRIGSLFSRVSASSTTLRVGMISISLDHSSQKLVFGSLCSTSDPSLPLVPLLKYSSTQEYTQFQVILQAWNAVIEENNRSLQLYSPAMTTTLTTEQRKQWWQQRTEIDQQMKKVLEDMNTLLAPILHDLLLATNQATRSGERKIESVPTMELSVASKSSSFYSIASEETIDQSDLRLDGEDTENVPMHANQLQHEIDKIDQLFEQNLQITDTNNAKVKTTKSSSSASSCSSTALYEKMKLIDLKQELKKRGLGMIGKKAELIQRLVDDDTNRTKRTTPLKGSKSSNSLITKRAEPKMRLSRASTSNALLKASSPVPMTEAKTTPTVQFQNRVVFLLIDDRFQHFPFESLACLQDSSCSRLLSLVHLLRLQDSVITNHDFHHQQQEQLKEINPKKALFLVDLENNLPDTAQRMKSFIESHPLSTYWTTFTSAPPPETTLRESILTNEVLVYCGHGSGETYHKVIRKESVVPASFLFGCSSVRLKDRGFHESIGSLKLLLEKNSPFVIGNLWDVTDKDLDRFTIETLSHYFRDHQITGYNYRLVTPKTRASCRLVTAVGTAPVVYGFPLCCSSVSV